MHKQHRRLKIISEEEKRNEQKLKGVYTGKRLQRVNILLVPPNPYLVSLHRLKATKHTRNREWLSSSGHWVRPQNPKLAKSQKIPPHAYCSVVLDQTQKSQIKKKQAFFSKFLCRRVIKESDERLIINCRSWNRRDGGESCAGGVVLFLWKSRVFYLDRRIIILLLSDLFPGPLKWPIVYNSRWVLYQKKIRSKFEMHGLVSESHFYG